MASGIYNKFKYQCFAGGHDLEDDSPSDEIKIALMDDNHVFNATDNMWAQVSGNELAAAGNYIAGGEALENQSITQLATTKFDANNTTWSNATFSAYHAVIYNATTLELVASIDFGGVKDPSGVDFTIQWNASGIMTLATKA